MDRKKIIYVNFAPYDNAGRILDFLVNSFSVVVHFSYDHLRLKNGRRSTLTVYKNKKKVLHKNLLWMRTPEPFLFLSLPLVALVILLQTIFEVFKQYKKFGKFDFYFTTNAYTAWVGNMLRIFKLTTRTIFWVWDYFPPEFPDWRLRFARWVYWQFDNPAIASSDKVVFLNKNLAEARINLPEFKKMKSITVIPIGTNYISQTKKQKRLIIGHMGMLKKGQGLDLLFDSLPELIKKVKNIQVEIIGSGPDEKYFRKRAKKFSKVIKFYGFVQNDDEVDRLISRWRVGIATYVPEISSEHYWTDPSKIKAYINLGVPVITTAVPEFAKEIETTKAGLIIDYYKKDDFIDAVIKLLYQKGTYTKGAITVAKKYNYKQLYPKLFK